MKSILTVIGTRPEAIKLAPVLMAITKSHHFESKICVTGQHTQLLDPYLLEFGIIPHYRLESSEKESSLHNSAAYILKQLDAVLSHSKPDLVLVQGDTTTAFITALSAYYSRIPVAHIEAGLRTGNLYSPWPEEGHRALIDRLTTYFFVPTAKAQNILLSEGVRSEKIWVVGNTSIDVVRLYRERPQLPDIQGEKFTRFIIVTVHRRENHGKPLKDICQALLVIAKQFPDVQIKFLLHLNPAIRQPVITMMSGVVNIDLIEPMDHSSFMQLLDKCTFVITDSGGLQEEVLFMGKPVLVLRDTTERPEGIQLGTALLVGTKSANIVKFCKELLENPDTLAAMSKAHNSYGIGYASEQIVNILNNELNKTFL
jgi:UDP-N-acetylglucosamine 2-epimerase (non-hydrolysing)